MHWINGLPEWVADLRDKWWQDWEDANGGPGRLGYDIEQGWDAAWECFEQWVIANVADPRPKGWAPNLHDTTPDTLTVEAAADHLAEKL